MNCLKIIEKIHTRIFKTQKLKKILVAKDTFINNIREEFLMLKPKILTIHKIFCR